MIYRYTQDKELYDILEATVIDMMSAQDADGRISSYDREHEFKAWDIWCRKYVFLGMQYFYDICENEELKNKITKTLCGHLDYIMKYIGPASEGKLPIVKASADWHGLNSSSLLEPVMRLYNVTKEEKYLAFAKHIVDEGGAEGFNVFEYALNSDLMPYQYQDQKAYEMTSCFEGLLEYYRVTGDENCLKSVVNYSKKLIDSEVTILGSLGTVHELLSNAKNEQTNPDNTGIMQETCVTVTWMKFCLQLLRITGESIYADEIERSMFNDMLGSVNTEKCENGYGMPFDSYSPLMPGSRGRGTGGLQFFRKEGESGAYGCCACIGSAGVAVPMLAALMESEKGLAVNFYMQGETETNYGKIKIITDYPLSGKVKISMESEKEFEFKFRIPSFSIENEIKLNGEKINEYIIPGEYFAINRKWNKSDTVEITLDLRAKVINAPETGSHPYSKLYYAISRGPVVLARDKRISGKDLDRVVIPKCDENGYIELVASNKADFNCLEEYEVPMQNGESMVMIDASSAGKTWDETSEMSVWHPTEKHWNTDLTKPVTLYFPGEEHWKYAKNRFLEVDANGNFAKSLERSEVNTEAYKFILEFAYENIAKIKDPVSGKYLTEENDKPVLRESDDSKAQLWEIRKDYKDKYYIISENSKMKFMPDGGNFIMGDWYDQFNVSWFIRN